MSKTYGQLIEGESDGTLNEKELHELTEARKRMVHLSRIVSLSMDEHIRSVDPHRRKQFMAALIVAGRRRGLSIYDSEDFLKSMAEHISNDLDSGTVGFMQDLAELSGSADVVNRQCSCVFALLDFYRHEERWPTKRELEIYSEKMFPDLFSEMDDKQWRRTRKNLGITWLDDAQKGRKKGA